MSSYIITNSGEDSFGPDAENRSAALFVNRDVLLKSRGRPADYGRRDAAHNRGADASGFVAEPSIKFSEHIGGAFLIKPQAVPLPKPL